MIDRGPGGRFEQNQVRDNAIRAIRLIGQLSAPNYAWDASQVQQIGSELDKALSDTLAKFRRSSHGPKAESLFRLVQTPTQQQAA